MITDVKSFKIKLIDRKEAKPFVETWHYSKNINGLRISYCFGLFDQDKLIGVSIFGAPGMNNQSKKWNPENPSKLLELRRLCCIDDTPKNTESYFIGKCLKWLKKNTDLEVIISYSDLSFGHEGVIYKASNFKKVGLTPGGRVIIYNGKRYHDKTIRTKYKGELKPFAKKIKEALENGDANYIKTKGKIIYLYKLK
jgi:hypothetical protein